jgi:hypothetical protein
MPLERNIKNICGVPGEGRGEKQTLPQVKDLKALSRVIGVQLGDEGTAMGEQTIKIQHRSTQKSHHRVHTRASETEKLA